MRKRLSRSVLFGDQPRQCRGILTIIHYIPLRIDSGTIFCVRYQKQRTLGFFIGEIVFMF